MKLCFLVITFSLIIYFIVCEKDDPEEKVVITRRELKEYLDTEAKFNQLKIDYETYKQEVDRVMKKY